MHVSLIVPAPFDLISGGYGYDRRIVSGLRAAAHEVAVMELHGASPMADDAARDSAHDIWARLASDTKPVIDGLALPAFAAMADVIAARGVVGLIHHPLSLETGLSDRDHSALDAVERRLLPCLARLIVTSPVTATTLVEAFHIPSELVRVVVPGTDDAPRCQGSGGATCQILAIGTLIPRKGHDVLLRALARLPDLNWRLTIVGSPDRDHAHARELATLAEALKIAHRVRFAGELVGEALEAEWRAADVFALATHYEGYGMAIAEALKRGLPVVVASGGAAGALVSPGAGYVCPVGDPDAVAQSLRLLIPGGEPRHAMAARAWQTGQTLPSWDDQSNAFARALG